MSSTWQIKKVDGDKDIHARCMWVERGWPEPNPQCAADAVGYSQGMGRRLFYCAEHGSEKQNPLPKEPVLHAYYGDKLVGIASTPELLREALANNEHEWDTPTAMMVGELIWRAWTGT